MKHSDFYIGLEFLGRAGFRWRCTDVGTRTIIAIQVDKNDPNWYQGPPFIAKEVVFDEKDIPHCFLTETEAITSAIREHNTSGHPGYPSEAVFRMMDERSAHHYPHKGVLRFDRKRADGEILHPYAGRKEGDTWIISLYLPFQNVYDSMPESDFIALPRASAEDIRARVDS
ncbi:hypothetical protein [Alloalcanivorax xenomutans]|uniref:Uncharacterized protein n=1 Tax=Alloalcanivorax xenomutans TaxID=1094342 RepID=A0A9Q3W4F2_9GAMM|nr:hypothetical protein [Alloalcanivorax xenomutans]KYZ85055.1 hypothetical protein A3Q32_21025 [Alcanivorax sp. KX64203]ARB46080.1 hypothetical protein P40_12265 [Alloalcanivorax xenomutans]MCE7508416.1 hypothetical protein [Alloalcanivorax xenomutans]MCE7521874.1 hypothetical protein [Alloalcanivorax xenomutans]WOD26659.1 hypothetical protein RYH70_11575 [Alloalcanivorax xenomutans]